MKLTRRQLRKLIVESLFDDIKSGVGKFTGAITNFNDYLSLGSTKDDLVAGSSQDAYDMFRSMQGLGTDEGKIKDIFAKRKDDLLSLYNEYDQLIELIINPEKGAIDNFADELGLTPDQEDSAMLKTIAQYDKNLIEWLEDDGMEEEALALKNALNVA